MQLSNKQKAYGGVLGLCAAAFLLDRTILGPGEVAAAEPLEPVVRSAAAAGTTPVVTTTSDGPSVGTYWALAQTIDNAAEEQQIDMKAVRNAFMPSDRWFPEPVPEVKPELPAGPNRAELFLERHELQAVMASGDVGIAVIDGRSLRVGQTIDGFTLVRVAERSAELENADGDQVVLELEQQSAGSDA